MSIRKTHSAASCHSLDADELLFSFPYDSYTPSLNLCKDFDLASMHTCKFMHLSSPNELDYLCACEGKSSH